MLKYGDEQPKEIHLEDIYKAEVPIGMFVAKYDLEGDLIDAHWTRDQILDGKNG